MNADRSNRTLTTLLESSFEDSAGGGAPEPDMTAPELPSLDRRVDTYVQAMYGLERVQDEALRALARDRILGAMARDLADEDSPSVLSPQTSDARHTPDNRALSTGAAGFVTLLTGPFRKMQSAVGTLLSPDSFSTRRSRFALVPIAALLVVGSVSVLTMMPGRLDDRSDGVPRAGTPAEPGSSGRATPTRSIPEIDVSSEADLKRQIFNLEMKVGPSHMEIVPPLVSLAKLMRSQNRYREAESLYRRALDIQEHTPDASKPLYAQTLRELAELYRVQGRTDQAEKLLQQAR